jgi:very-long-chain enoyl-CoA reductase
MSYLVIVNVFSNQIRQVNQTVFWLGFILFFIGEYINYYHHLILSQLRQDGSKKYKIPMGGLFEYMWCPHYVSRMILNE